MTQKAIPELSAEASVLIKRLKQMQFGEVIPYKVLAELCGEDVQYKKRHLLQTAVHAVLREDRIVVECVHGVGVKRVDAAGIVSIGQQSRMRENRLARRTLRKLVCADAAQLDREQQIEHYSLLSMFGAIAAVTKEQSFQKLKSAVSVSQQHLPLNQTLEAFKT